MLFISHKFNTNICGFCNHADEVRVDTFGFNSTNDMAAICSNCLQKIINNALHKKSKTYNNTKLSKCDFCGQSIPEITRVFTNGKSGICEECISNFISTSLWIGKKQGVEYF